MKKYKIFFDTNQLFNDKKGSLVEPFNNSIPNLKKFLTHHKVKNVTLCLPEIVIRERIQQKKQLIENCLIAVNEKITLLKDVGYTQKEIKLKSNYEKQLEKNATDFLIKYNIEKIDNADLDLKDLIDRAILKKKPFNDKTAGFKDTLIYLSILNDAIKDKTDIYIFCTENHRDFTQDVINDFELISHKKLFIVPNSVTLTEKLDELLPIGLHLEERNDEIENIIMKNIGTLMANLNKNTNDSSSLHRVRGTYAEVFTNTLMRDAYSNITDISIPSKNEDRIVGYNYIDSKLSGVEDTQKNNVRVNYKITTEIIYKESSNKEDNYFYNNTLQRPERSYLTAIWSGYDSELPRQKIKDFYFIIDVNLDQKSISINSRY